MESVSVRELGESEYGERKLEKADEEASIIDLKQQPKRIIALGRNIPQVSNVLLPEPSKLNIIHSGEKSPNLHASNPTSLSDLSTNPNPNTSDLPIQTDSTLIPSEEHLTISNILET